jgi:hypothetical protein
MGILLTHCREFSFQLGKTCVELISLLIKQLRDLNGREDFVFTHLARIDHLTLKAVKPLQRSLALIPIERIDSQT